MPRPRFAPLLLLGLAAPATADARAATQVAPGQRLSLSADLSGATSCALRSRRTRRRVETAGAIRVTFSFRVHRRARAGHHRVTIACAPGRVQRFAVRVRRTGRRGRPVRLLVSGRVAAAVLRPGAPSAPTGATPAGPPQPMTPQRADAEAAAWWAGVAAVKARRWRNGECTDWAQRKRPDIVERAERIAYARRLLDPAGGLLLEPWIAANWDDNARAAGLAVSGRPSAGAIAVQERGVDGAGAASGHVAYVEEVLPDGRFRVSEMNAPVPFQVSSSVRRAGAGWSFIH